MLTIRKATSADYDAVWEMFHEVVAAGDYFAFDPNISRKEALDFWFAPGTHNFVAELDCLKQSSSERERRVVGSYFLKANQGGGGGHVSNAGYMVSSAARGRGVGRAMAEHSLVEARRLGFRAMQFNFVVSTNESAVYLWKELGFEIVGTLPGAFRHPEKGFVDVYVMFHRLDQKRSE